MRSAAFNTSTVGFKRQRPVRVQLQELPFNTSTVGFKPCHAASRGSAASSFQYLYGGIQAACGGRWPSGLPPPFNTSTVGFKLGSPTPTEGPVRPFNTSTVGFKRAAPPRRRAGTAGAPPFNTSTVGFKRIRSYATALPSSLSIPLRWDSSASRPGSVPWWRELSIPLRWDSSMERASDAPRHSPFNTSTVGFKPAGTRRRPRSRRSPFNTSTVGFKLPHAHPDPVGGGHFQYLYGGIQATRRRPRSILASNFQYLYGGIQAGARSPSTPTSTSFQYLYGGIQADGVRPLLLRAGHFQYLYGGIQARTGTEMIAAERQLSIPLRWDSSKTPDGRETTIYMHLSIPLRWDSSRGKIASLRIGRSFQYLYGGIQALAAQAGMGEGRRFQYLYGGIQALAAQAGMGEGRRFQYLYGGIQASGWDHYQQHGRAFNTSTVGFKPPAQSPP